MMRERTAVLLRTLCLGAYVTRGLFEQALDTRTDKQETGWARVRVVLLERWLAEQGLEEFLSEEEAADMALPHWDSAVINRASWRVEALGPLAWAIHLVDGIPAADALYESASLVDRLPLQAADIEAFLREGRLRSADDLLWARDIAELWHWRARIEAAHRRDLLSEAEATRRVRKIARGAFEHGAIPEPVADDFPAFGGPFRALTDEQLPRVHSAAYQRHYALNWICGYGTGWDSTPTDTV
ncbi:MAG: DUF4272 domain-containing protein [Anaerolineae bacterium]